MNIELAIGLLEGKQWLGIGLDQVNRHVGRNELDIVVEAHDFAGLQGFDVLLVNVAGLIIEEAVRVTGPGNTTHVNFEVIGLRQLVFVVRARVATR